MRRDTVLASGPYETQTRLTQIAQAAMPMGMIADKVCMRVRTPYKFTYTTITEEDILTIPDTRASRSGRLNQAEVGSTDKTDSVEDYGLEDPVPYRDIDEAAKQEVPFDPLDLATETTSVLVSLAREQRVKDLLFTAGNYDANLTAAAGTKWDAAGADPIQDISEALDKPLIRPNTMVLGQPSWTVLRRNPKIVEAINMSGAGAQAAGLVMRDAIAALFELDNVYVGQTWYQSAKRGQNDVFARLWGDDCALLHLNPNPQAKDRVPSFCWTADAMGGMQVGTYEEAARGVSKGSVIVKVSDCVKELIAYKQAGYLIKNVKT